MHEILFSIAAIGGCALAAAPPAPDLPPPTFRIGDLVRKRSGYAFPGVVVGVFWTLAGKERVNVEAEPGHGFDGMQHIFAPEQLEIRSA